MLDAIIGGIGGIVDSIFGNDQAEEQAKLQKEFAQNAVQWKVRDAKKAGIHPLYALGAPTMSYTPVTVGTDFASMGQNLGRAFDAARTPGEKQTAFQDTVESLTLEKMGLENEVLRSQLRTVNQAGHPPGMPASVIGAPAAATSMSGGGGGVTVNVNPANTPAEDAEAQYGEIGGEVIGVTNLGDDLLRTHLPRAAETGHITQPVIDAINTWLVQTGNAIYANRPKKPRPYTFIPNE